RAGGDPARAARPDGAPDRGDARPEPDLAAHRVRGGLDRPRDDARPRLGPEALRPLLGDEPPAAPPAHVGLLPLRGSPAHRPADRDGRGVAAQEPLADSGRFLIPSRVDHFDHESWSASRSSFVNFVDMLIRATTTPGISPSSTSWSIRANVRVNS